MQLLDNNFTSSYIKTKQSNLRFKEVYLGWVGVSIIDRICPAPQYERLSKRHTIQNNPIPNGGFLTKKINAIKAHFEKNICVSMCGLEFITLKSFKMVHITYYDNIK